MSKPLNCRMTWTGVACAVVLLGQPLARGEDAATAGRPTTPQVNEHHAQTTDPTPPQLDYITRQAQTLGLSPQRIDNMRNARKMGWGEIETSLGLASQLVDSTKDSEFPQSGDQALDQVLRLRADGEGWGDIAHALGTSVGEVRGKGHDRDAKRSETGEQPEGRPESAGRPESPGRSDKLDRGENLTE